ncbi:helix-turn-helix transcriptional regulator [Paenibacillus sp. IB182496]|uniref:Helix-turn-helix transcriptional regulator n=1 Tax=Paenibacillus sabuli TaxID=2772509 RepID=A0A927GPY2_9BACL|nr:AraC family transcriptional regulator [Paenibacillus sabuli]MBD2843798.1 helix-turn-helix transcriptional regulator [Paenibacillus sabuli]
MNQPRYPRTPLHETIAVNQLVSLHYFEFSKDFSFEGEKHDFWEFVYVDKGELAVFADTEGYVLRQGDMIFHQPNEFHGVWANRITAPNVIILSFVCRSPAMAFFAHKIMTLAPAHRELLAEIVRNGFAAYEPPYDDPRNHTLVERADAPIGAVQLIKIHLELLLLRLLHAEGLARREQRRSRTVRKRSEADLVQRMRTYMERHLHEDLQLEQIYRSVNLSKTHALTLFKAETGQSIMKHYRALKIERAKQLIREERHTYTEIAGYLGYSSIHAFSRQFKSVTGMSPSEYAHTVKAKL